MRDVSELVESETIQKGGWRRRVWGVVWKALLVMLMACGIWMYMQPVAPAGWYVLRKPRSGGLWENLSRGNLRSPAMIFVRPDKSDLDGRKIITPKALDWLKSEAPIAELFFTSCDFSGITSSGLGDLNELERLSIHLCALGDEQLAIFARAKKLRELSLTNYGTQIHGCQDESQAPPWDESFEPMAATLTATGMKAVWKMKAMQRLDLRHVAIGDAGLKGVSRSKSLSSLVLEDCSIKGEALQEIALMKRVSNLSLNANPIEDDALEHLVDMAGLKYLSLGYTLIGDEGLEHVKKLKGLTRLGLDHTHVTDEGVAKLMGMPSLSGLSLDHTKLTDRGLVHISTMKGMRSLDLKYTQVTNEGLGVLVGLPELRMLHLSGTSLTDEGLVHLAKFGALEYLTLDYTAVTDNGLEQIAATMKGLAGLYLSHTQITDDGLKHLASMPKLRHLMLGGAAITDAGLVHLAELKSLETLSLKETAVTPEASEAFESKTGIDVRPF